MRKTWIRWLSVLALAFGSFTATSRADLILTLEPKDLDMNPVTGSVAPGTRLLVDILVSVDEEHDLGLVLDSFDLDFRASSDTIVRDAFSFKADMSAYITAFGSSELPRPSAFSGNCNMLDCIPLTRELVLLAQVEVIVNGDGELNVAGSEAAAALSGFHAVDPEYSLAELFMISAGNLQGGILELTVNAGPVGPGGGGSGPVDTDGDSIPDETDPDDDNDGVLDVDDDFPIDPAETVDSDQDGVGDNADAFPDDPAETTDTDNDGIGNAADDDDDNDGVLDANDADPLDPSVTDEDDNSGTGGSRGPCGIAMLQTSIFIFLGLSGMGRARRRIHRRGAA